MNKNTKKGILFLLTAAFTYSTMPVLIRMLGNQGIPPISQVFLRYVFSFIASSIYFFIITKSKFMLPGKNIPLLLFAALFGYGMTNVFYTIGIVNTEISNALFLFFTFAIWAPILGFVFLKEKVNKYNLFALGLSFLAIYLLFQPSTFSTWKLGGAFALLAALAQSAYIVSRKRLADYTAGYMMVVNTSLATLLTGALSLVLEHEFYLQGAIKELSPAAWMVVVLFGFLNFLAWLAMTKGFEYFNSSSSSIILLSELIFGVIFAFMFFGEIPIFITFAGGILIFIASVIVIFRGEQ